VIAIRVITSTHRQSRIVWPRAGGRRIKSFYQSTARAYRASQTLKVTYSAFSDFLEDLGAGVLRDVVGDFEVSEGAGALGVDNALGDSLTVEVSHFVDEVDILEQDWTALAYGLGSSLHANWASMPGGGSGWSALHKSIEQISSVEQFSATN
jgi:hypothetical protein